MSLRWISLVPPPSVAVSAIHLLPLSVAIVAGSAVDRRERNAATMHACPGSGLLRSYCDRPLLDGLLDAVVINDHLNPLCFVPDLNTERPGLRGVCLSVRRPHHELVRLTVRRQFAVLKTTAFELSSGSALVHYQLFIGVADEPEQIGLQPEPRVPGRDRRTLFVLGLEYEEGST